MKERIEYFDIAKGILIIMMVFGHVFEDGPVRQFIYVFHMPAFFIISGMQMNYSSSLKKPCWNVFVSRVYSLIVPFLFFELIGCITDIIRDGFHQTVFGYINNTLHLDYNYMPNYFLLTLFISNLLFVLIYKITKGNRRIVLPIVITIAIACLFLPQNKYFIELGQKGVALAYIAIGYFFKDWFNKYNVVSVIISFVLVCFTAFINGPTDWTGWNFGNPVIYFAGAFIGTYFILNVSKYIHFKPLLYLGQNTLTVFGTHWIFISLLYTYVMYPFTLPFAIFVFVFVCLLEFPIIYIFNRFIPFLIGKNLRERRLKSS